MNVRSLKLAGAVAGLLCLVGTAPNVYAQTAVLNFSSSAGTIALPGGDYYSLFTFSSPLILNEIGFVTTTGVTPTFSYQINGGVLKPVTVSSTITGSDGVAWHTLETSLQMNDGDTVKLFNYSNTDTSSAIMYKPGFAAWSSSNADVTFGGYTNESNVQYLYGTVGNIRVSPSNPGSNVAPEPGSIALLLTSGGALAGIALRRRRNAA